MQVGLGLDVVNLVVFENEIPDFDEPVFVSRGAAVTPVFRAAVNVNLGAGAAGAGAASGPEVVFHTEHLHMFGVEAFVLPDRTRFLIVGEGGNPELFGVETVAALVLRGGQQLPRVMNCLLLEVITEGEVAQHLEESAVAGGFSDLVDIERTHALLVRGHARGGRRLLTEQVRDERHHACNGEQGCRVRRDERSRRHDQMAMLLEIREVTLCDVCCAHKRDDSLCCVRLAVAAWACVIDARLVRHLLL